MTGAEHEVEVAIVGGGPAGAALATRLAAAGHDVGLFERLARPRWRASGVYSSPLTRHRLRSLGVDEHTLAALIRPISAMVVETADGAASCRLEYPAPDHACGVDRVRLEQVLLERARAVGARVYEGAAVRQVDLGRAVSRLLVSQAAGTSWWKARLVVGADGPSSMVARAAQVTVPIGRYRRAAITGHRADVNGGVSSTQPLEARLIVGRGWYLGLAPVPDNRINLGLVVGEGDLRRRLDAGLDIDGVMDAAVAASSGLSPALRSAPPTDRLEVRLPLVHRVQAASGPGFLLVGDACGFIDPISGEGLHRALVSAELAALAARSYLHGDGLAFQDYDQRLRARFLAKDVVSWLLQLFLHQPTLARYALRRLQQRPRPRNTFARGLADLAPASTLLDPRFLARVLAP